MRIRRLVVEGFGPFARRQEVDLTELEAAGLFLITGRTGSGKSSILDAVCFALYGGAPRYDGARGRLRSDHARPDDPTRVELEFDAAGERWLVVRSPEYLRPKRRGEGFTTQREEATVARWDGAGWETLATRATDLPEVLGPVLQLNREQFLQVILLAQGRFQEFLRARSEDRVGLLRALFGTERFQRFEAELVQRAKALEQRIAAADAGTAGDLARLGELAGCDEAPGTTAAPGIAAALADEAEAAAIAGREAGAAFDAADALHGEQVRLAGLQRRRTEATALLSRLAEQDDAVDIERGRVAAALRALPVTPAADRADHAEQDRLAAMHRRSAASGSVDGVDEDPEGAAAALDGEIGALAAAAADETALPGLRRAALQAEAARDEARAALAAIAAEAAAVPDERARLAAALADAAAGGAAQPGARAGLDRTEGALRSARTAVRLRTAAAESDAAHARALAVERDAAAFTLRLVEARAAGAAALLAETLQDGDACPVCGSAEHPAPARPGADRVDDAAVAAAQQDQDIASTARAGAADRAAAVRVDLAAAEAASGGAAVEDAEHAVEDAAAALAAADASIAEAARLQRLLAQLDERAALLTAREDAARAVLADRDGEVATARERVTAATARVAAGRGDAERVADRVAALRRRRDLLRALAAAVRAEDSATADAAHAAQVLATALDEGGFADVPALRAAALPRVEREALEQRVHRHEQQRSAAAAQLADAEVAGAAQQPADVADATAAKQQALDAQREAARREADRTARARQAAVLADRVRAAAEETADARDQLRVAAPLAAAVRGNNEMRMRLEAYVLAARLEQIVAAANLRLATMTDGRYTLRHDDTPAERNQHSGLGLEVMDEHTGRTRPIASLSGGETFLASLALALGLAEVVSEEAGGVRLDTLFVDEGFGSLDRQTLDTAMETLDSLRAGGRVVGLISHVEAMQEDIPAGLHVERQPDGSSSVRLRVPALG